MVVDDINPHLIQFNTRNPEGMTDQVGKLPAECFML